MTSHLPQLPEQAIRRGLVREILEHAGDVHAEGKRYLAEPSELGMRDLRDRVDSLGRVASQLDALG